MADQTAPAGATLELTGEDLRDINAYLREHPAELLQIGGVREIITRNRFKRVGPEGVRTIGFHSRSVIENTIKHNFINLQNMLALARPNMLINPIRASHYILTNAPRLKVLTIGPRTEVEIFALLAAGFAPQNVRGLDLMSYSPFVDVGDMHDMPYPDASFDVIILGWVLGYSNDNQRVANEVMRVARPGACIAIGHENDPRSLDDLDKQRGFALAGTGFKSTDEMLALFAGHVDQVLFRHDVHPKMRDVVCHIMTVFFLK